MRFCFVISSLGCGGTERVAVILANTLAKLGNEISIITFDEDGKSFYPLASGIRVEPLGLLMASPSARKAILNNSRRIKSVRKAIKMAAPNTVISFMDTTNVITVLATRGLEIPTIISEHSVPDSNLRNRYWRILRDITYAFSDALVVQTPEARDTFWKAVRKKTFIVPNPIDITDFGDEPEIDMPQGPFISAMGRLSHEKGFDILIRAFASIADNHQEWSLVILGEGPERKSLESLRDEHGLQDRVHLPGRTASPFSALKQSAIFALPSRFEGFSNALAEALACGLPAVASNCRYGPRHILTNEVDGLLVPPESPEAMANGLERLIADGGLRRSMAEASKQSRNRFAPTAIAQLWLNILNQKSTGR